MKILVPRFDTYGDIVLVQGLLGSLSQLWPDSKVHLLVRERFADLAPLCASEILWETTVLQPWMDRRGQLSPNDDVQSVLNQPWDLVLGTCFNSNWVDYEIGKTLAQRGARVVALAKLGAAGPGDSRIETVPVPEFSHETEKYQALLDYLSPDSGPILPPSLNVPPRLRDEAGQFLSSAGLQAGHFIVCVPGGGENNSLKLWSAENFARCIACCETEFGLRTLITGSEVESEIVQRTAQVALNLGATPETWIGGNGQIGFLGGILHHARAYLGNDTGPMHVAQALGIPAVAIFGGGHWPRFAPAGKAVVCTTLLPCFGCQWHCMYGEPVCITAVPWEKVFEGLRGILKGSSSERLIVLSPQPGASPPLGDIKRASQRFRDLAATVQELAPYRDEAERLTRMVSDLQAEVADSGRASIDLKRSSEFLKEQVAGAWFERNQFAAEVEKLKATIAEQSKRTAEMAEETSFLRGSLDEIRAESAGLRAIAEEMQGLCKSKDAEIEQQTRRGQELAETIRRLRDDPFEWLVESRGGPPVQVSMKPEFRPGLVSVVIPVYNGAAFLERCLRSVAEQAPGGFETEVFICDDGSTDGSGTIAQKLIEQSPIPARLLTHADKGNHGVSATRNLGIRECQGEFIALLDVDDVWLPGKLKTQIAYLREHGDAGCVCSLGYNKNAFGERLIGWSGRDLAGDYSGVAPPNDFLPPYDFSQLLRGDPIVNSTVVMRRSALRKTGGYVGLMAHQAEDWLLFQKIALQSPIHLIPAPLIDYTIHDDSYTVRYFTQGLAFGARIETMFQLLHWMLQHPEYRAQARWVYRRQLPVLFSGLGRTHQLIEQYYLNHNGNTSDLISFERHLSGVYSRLEELQHYKDHIEMRLNQLRRVPGLAPAYRALVRLQQRYAAALDRFQKRHG